jgi:hypothetical protein
MIQAYKNEYHPYQVRIPVLQLNVAHLSLQ